MREIIWVCEGGPCDGYWVVIRGVVTAGPFASREEAERYPTSTHCGVPVKSQGASRAEKMVDRIGGCCGCCSGPD